MAKSKSTESTSKNKLDIEIERIEHDFGKGSVIRCSSKVDNIETISTGSILLDLATGIGGLPKGKVVELIGWESSGKSTICLNAIAACQKKGGVCVLVDGENSFDAKYAIKLGVNPDDILYVQLDENGGERCYNIADRLMRTGGIDLVVIDSQTSLLPKKNFDTEIGDSKLGIHSRLMSESVPKLMNAATIGGALVIYVSQIREKIGIIFGSPETTSGGNALRFYAHMRIEMRKTVEREEKIAFANWTKCKIIKNKLAAPFKEAEFRINFGTGVDRMKEICDLGIETGIIKQSGSWFSYDNNRLGQGEDSVLQLLNDNEDLAEQILKESIKKYKGEENSIEERKFPTQEVSTEEIKTEEPKTNGGETSTAEFIILDVSPNAKNMGTDTSRIEIVR